ncbi:hypothetical protein ACVWWQ_002706 [Rhodanobacter sp. TND4EL1]
MTALTTQMYPTCMGRFLIDLPKGMNNASVNSYITLYYGLGTDFKTVEVTIEALNTTPQAMAGSVAKKAADIGQDDNWVTKKSMLIEHKVINDHTIYLRYQNSGESSVGFKRELHLLLGTTQIVLLADSFEGLNEAFPDQPPEPVETGDQVDARLYRLASQIHAYDDPAKAGPGFCLGPVVINGDQDEESAHISFDMNKYLDLGFSVDTKALTSDKDDSPLLDRMKAVQSRFNVHVLRKGQTTLGDMQAQEWLGWIKDEHDNHGLSFAVESMRDHPALERPKMTFQLDTGGQLTSGPKAGQYVASSLTNDEGIALWNAIITSVRPRPGAVQRPSSAN